MKFFKSVFVFIFLASFLFTACNSPEEVDPGTAPELPPLESMAIDFSFFGGSDIGGRTMESNNWQRAASVVGFWNVILSVNMALPVTAFAVAVDQTPAYDFDRKIWVWTYTYNFVGKDYTSELTGELKDGEVEWKMYISEQGGFQNALWYTGIMEADGSSGYWLLNYNGDNPTEYLRIDWTKENEEVGDITFTYILNGSADYGSYIEYTENTGTQFNRSYEVYLSNYDASVNIEWNSDASNGHIMDFYYFQDEDYHCWDGDFMDVEC